MYKYLLIISTTLLLVSCRASLDSHARYSLKNAKDKKLVEYCLNTGGKVTLTGMLKPINDRIERLNDPQQTLDCYKTTPRSEVSEHAKRMEKLNKGLSENKVRRDDFQTFNEPESEPNDIEVLYARANLDAKKGDFFKSGKLIYCLTNDSYKKLGFQLLISDETLRQKSGLGCGNQSCNSFVKAFTNTNMEKYHLLLPFYKRRLLEESEETIRCFNSETNTEEMKVFFESE